VRLPAAGPGGAEPALKLDASTRLLVVAPHPDDETIGTGELIQQARAAGGTARVLLLTDGDNNPWPQRWLERRLLIGAAERARWGRRRRGEVAGALARLGLEAGDLTGLGWPDMGLTGKLRAEPAGAVATIAAAIEAAAPNLVALPALGDRHPDHGSAHVLVRLALAALGGPPPQLLAYLVHGRDDGTDGERLVLPGVPARRRAKLAALEEHRSQTALSGGRIRRLAAAAETFERVVARPRPPREAALPWAPPPALRPWLRLTVAGPGGVRTWRWREAPLARRADARAVLALPDGLAGGGPLFAKLHVDLPSPWIFDHWGWREL
jgi:LmbE family N-acetylglucosaminyl deacetylase